ncbi:S9 family peptidase [Granulicella mallensis]|uniref:Pimeloyl-ACP methyl ester carboxylesterase n=1 Tax=Granulicella mallensis TaxID=940614 RepID=A0A7W8ECX3_9BACT|nr:alpha/beta hydrolase [Granulicella mallensis]MBB5066080.1 pimeloyl-ACP methyl ester carboxylesterase [Granulicella mallensis]
MFRTRIALFVGVTFAATILTAQTAAPPQQPALATPFLESPTQTAPQSLSKQTSTYEDWTTIDLAKSGLPLDSTGSVPLSKADVQGCTRELHRLTWRLNDPVDLYVIRPRGQQKMPVVLFLYDYTVEAAATFPQDRWCDVATRNGFAVAGFASALSLERIRPPRPLREWFVSELQEALATSTHDVQMVLNYMETRGDLDVQHVGLVGQGSGGATAILAAAADPRIRALDLMDPWGDWPDWLKGSKQIPENERADYLKPEFLQRVSGLDPVVYLPQLKGKAIRIQQVLSDPVTPDAAKDKIAKAAPAPDEVMHYPDIAAEAKALGSNGIVKWMGAQLGSGNTVEAESAH